MSGALVVMSFSGVLLFGGCAGAPWPSNGKLPEGVVDRLTECGKKGPVPLESVSYDLTFTVHATEEDAEVRVDEVMLTGSTLHVQDVEACMTDAFYGMRAPLDVLALRRHKVVPQPDVTPEARSMFGQVEAVVFLEAGAAIVVGFAAYYVIVHVVMDKRVKKPRAPVAHPESDTPPAPPPVPVASAVTAEPTATAAPTVAPVPVTTSTPKARRYPNQTCEDDELDRLEGEKDRLCKVGYAVSCKGDLSKPKFARIACSAIKLSILQRQQCLAARKLVQDKCFGGKPDVGHKTQIDEIQNGIDNCEALRLINCAKGHPMAAL